MVKYLLTILFVITCTLAFSQQKFVAKKYNVGDKIRTTAGKIFQATTTFNGYVEPIKNNKYWQEITIVPVIYTPKKETIDSLRNRIAELEALFKDAVILKGMDTVIIKRIKK